MQFLNRVVSSLELRRLLCDASLDELMALISAGHEVHFEKVRVGDAVLECLQFSNMEAYIDQQIDRPDVGSGIDILPLWAKIWPATMPLAIYLQNLTPAPSDRILEIGAGLGLAGLFAAKRGFSVVVSDISPEALVFVRINVLRNGLEDAVQVMPIDFLKDDHQGDYGRIIGSELLYREQFFEPLLRFLLAHLVSNPQSEVLLTADASRRSVKFFAVAKNHFQISRSAIPYQPDSAHEDGGSSKSPAQTIYIYRMRPR